MSVTSRRSLPHALLVASSRACPHALRPLEVRCALPLGMSLCWSRLPLPHTLRDATAAAVALPHALLHGVSASCGLPHALALLTPVTANIRLPHGAYNEEPDVSPPVSCVIAGREVQLLSLELSADEDAFAIQGSLELAGLDDWLRLAAGDLCVVSLGDSAVQLLVDGRTRSREFGSQRLVVEASSPASRLAAPHADPLTRTWEDATAMEIAAELCDMAAVTLDWRICDWRLESFAVEARTPMEALTTVITAAARAVSAPDGTLTVQYHYPVTPARYALSAVDLSLSDFDDITLIEQESQPRPCYDKVQLLAEATGNGDVFSLQEWKGPHGQQDMNLARGQRLVAVFSWPVQNVTLQTSGCETTLQDQGEHAFDFEEVVEFVNGEARLSYPALELLEYTWRCENLGAITVDGTALTAELTSPGCSLAKVRYASRCQLFLVESQTREAVQVFASSQEATASGLLLTLQRGAGLRPSPETIVDPLCQSEAILRQRGRNYLDEQGYNKELYEAATPPRPLLLPGALVQVTDGSLQEIWRAKLTGWQASATADAGSSVRWILERSVGV